MPLSKRASAEIHATDSGEFDLLLSNGIKDRDGEVLAPGDWVVPLPDVIPINLNHSEDVAKIVGSGQPFIDPDGNLRVRGKFADTDQAQHIRQLVTGGHLRSVSVEFLRHAGGRNELVGGAFVNVPANPQARVLASKSALDQFKVELNRLFDREVGDGDSDDVALAALLRLRLKVAGR